MPLARRPTRTSPPRTLNENQVLQILLHLAPIDSIHLTLVSKNDIFAPKKATMEGYWEHYARRVFQLEGLHAATNADGAVGKSWGEIFQSWHQALRSVSPANALLALRSDTRPSQHVGHRWVTVWRRIKSWLKENPSAKQIKESLRNEAADLSALEKMGALPSVMNCWRMVDGQDVPLDPQVASMARTVNALGEGDQWSHGLFGGYQTYDHEVCTVFLPLDAAMNITQHFCQMLRDRIPDLTENVLANKVVFAMSFNAVKVFFVDVRDGRVYVFTRKRFAALELAVPDSGATTDGFVRWFEEYGRRLQSNFYTMDYLRPEEAPLQMGISLFPNAPPELTVCVTRGVEVRASCIYMPEHQAGWTYSIAIRLVGTKEERGFEQCQLVSRHWEIEEEGRHECERVDGDGVIGLFPILVEGGWLRNRESDPHGQYPSHGRAEGAFRYQSCSGRNGAMRGRFGGAMTFVPGTRKQPSGETFRVKVEPFRLYVPQYMY